MLYLGVEGTFDHLAHHNIYVAKDYRRNLDEIERQHVLSEDPSFYVANPVRTDATMAPPGHSALYVLLPVTHQHPNVDWNKERARYRAWPCASLKNSASRTSRSASASSAW
jgi:phytoene desaturase